MADTQDLDSFSIHLEMRDGVRLAIQVLGAGGFRERRAAAVVVFTRYGRATPQAIAAAPFSESLEFTRLGYVVVSVDVRGTGASFGSRQRNRGHEELEDCREVFDWTAVQPWCDGRLYCTGVSYGGNVADLVQVLDHPALVAVAPRFTDFDIYRHLLFPGGVPNIQFARLWGELTAGLDRGDAAADEDAQGRRAANFVDGDDGTLYAQALAEHAANADFTAAMSQVVCRDELLNDTNLADLAPAIAAAARPAFHWASWMDAGTAAGALERFQAIDAPMRVRIGAWSHGAIEVADPLDETRPRSPDERREDIAAIAAFFEAAKDPIQRVIEYRTLGRPGWRTTPVWPPRDVGETALWLAEGGRLLARAAETRPGWDRLEVDFDMGTGMESRWSTQIGARVAYPDREATDARLATYTSAPLAADLEIVGAPRVTLRVTPSRDDGLVLVYLELVRPEGPVTYLTEGQLRLLHRGPDGLSAAKRTYARAQARRTEPGVALDLEIDLLPLAALAPAGSRIRLAIAGADRDTFARVPPTGPMTLDIERGGVSRLVLPVFRTA